MYRSAFATLLARVLDADVRHQVIDLRRRLSALDTNTQEADTILRELDGISYRVCGRSFRGITHSKHASHLQLRVWTLLLALILPALSAFFVSQSRVEAILAQVDQIDVRIHTIDARIALDLSSPYYLSHVYPCSDEALSHIIKRTISVQWQVTDIGDCSWHYNDAETDVLLAIDYWILSTALERGYFVKQRVYYRDDEILARDSFTPFAPCFRERNYRSGDGEDAMASVCFSETGQAIASQRQAPIPPLIYWFFYR